jgi:hypothetical protein
MAMHNWSETDFDWEGLNNAIYEIAIPLRKIGRVNVYDFKEKWGQARISCGFGFPMVHNILYPGYAFKQYKHQWMWALDCYHGHKVTWLINLVAIPFQKWFYRYLYKKAVFNHPHLRQEILCAADWPELLENI